jgi:hypothetical protein
MSTELETEGWIRRVGEAARRLEVSDGLVARVAARAQRRPRRRLEGRSPAWIAGCLVVLAVGGVAVPAPRAALVGAIDRLLGDEAPGEALTPGQIPDWIAADRPAGPVRVIAGEGDDRLIVYRVHSPGSSPSICAMYGDSVGECSDAAGWREELADHPVVLRGPTGRPLGPRTLYGFLRGDVAQVRLEYERGPATVAPTPNGGFAITVGADRIGPDERPTRLVALDRSGRPIASEDVGDRFWSR